MKILIAALFFAFTIGNIAFSQAGTNPQVSFNCDPCYVNNCQCAVTCSSGKMYVYSGNYCAGTEMNIITFSNNLAEFFSVQPGQFHAQVNCIDSGENSACQPIFVSSYSGQTITTTTTQTYQTNPTQSSTTTTSSIIQTTQTTSARTTIITQTRTTTGTSGNNSQTFSLNTILTIVLVISALVMLTLLFLYYRSANVSAQNFNR